MAKVIITFEDDTDEDGRPMLNARCEFDPPLERGKIPTAAQSVGCAMLYAIKQDAESDDDE